MNKFKAGKKITIKSMEVIDLVRTKIEKGNSSFQKLSKKTQILIKLMKKWDS